MMEYFKSVLSGIVSMFIHAGVLLCGVLTGCLYSLISSTSSWVTVFVFFLAVLFGALTLLGLWGLGLLARGKIQLIESDKGVEKTDE